MKEEKVFYLCDGKVPTCSRRNCFMNENRKYKEDACRHTTDIHHAINFDHGVCERKEQFYEMMIADGRRVPACDRIKEIESRLRNKLRDEVLPFR